MEKMETEKIKEIALQDLRTCYQKLGIFASKINFSDYWARDSFWASIGIIKTAKTDTPQFLGIDLEKVKQSLELFIQHQSKNGKIPRKICVDYNGLKYLKIKVKRKKPRPIYASAIRPFYSFDDNLLFVIAFCDYVNLTKDLAFAKKYSDNLKSALEFYAEKGLVKNSLLYEIGIGNWQDTVFKRGFVLYTNCLWLEAVRDFENLLNNDAGIRHWHVSAETNIPAFEKIRSAFQEKFWLGEKGFFADSVSPSGEKQEYFDLAGNILAIVFNVASNDQKDKVFKNIENIENIHGYPSEKVRLHPINHPLYPYYRITPINFIFTTSAYQNGNNWSWIECLLIVALAKSGRAEKAGLVFKNLSRIVARNSHIHENYFLDGRPFDHLLWKSAVPFAWSAGLLLWAIAELEKVFNKKE